MQLVEQEIQACRTHEYAAPYYTAPAHELSQYYRDAAKSPPPDTTSLHLLDAPACVGKVGEGDGGADIPRKLHLR